MGLAIAPDDSLSAHFLGASGHLTAPNSKLQARAASNSHM
ncbi:hypothetical protein BFJ70_g13195 [Fusarium oxysporum]|nr:hypothetical protein BFJ70_g13195 [Fusarium oxysporum]